MKKLLLVILSLFCFGHAMENPYDISKMEENVEKGNTDYCYSVLGSSDELSEVAKPMLILAIKYYQSKIFGIALPSANITEEVLLKIVNKPRDDEFAKERAKMLKLIYAQNPDLKISDNILKQALKSQSNDIVDAVIYNYAYWNRLRDIPEDVKKNQHAKTAIEKYSKESKKYPDTLLHAAYFGNINQIKELVATAKEEKLKDALEIINIEKSKKVPETDTELNDGFEINNLNEIAKIIETELKKLEAKRLNKEKSEKEERKEIEKRANREFLDFCQWFAKIAKDENPLISFSDEQINILKKYKDRELNKNGLTPILYCISKEKIILMGQLLQLDVNQFCPTYDDQRNILTLDIIDFALGKDPKILKVLLNSSKVNVIDIISKWIKTKNFFQKYLNLLEKYPEFLWPVFEIIIKNNNFTLENFKTLLLKFNHKLLNEVDENNRNILIIVAQAERTDLVEHLISLKVPYSYKYKGQTISVFNFIQKHNSTFEYLNNLELERQKIAEQKKAQVARDKKEQKQKAADEYVQKMGWTPLMRAIQEGQSDAVIIELVNSATDLQVTDVAGFNAMQHAQSKGRQKIVDAIYYKLNSCKWDEYQKAAYKKDKKEFEKLIKKDKKINILDNSITPDLDNIDLYMHICHPQTNQEEQIDSILKIIQIKFDKDSITLMDAFEYLKMLVSIVVRVNMLEPKKFINIHLALGVVYLRLGNITNAKEVFDLVLKTEVPGETNIKNACKLQLSHICQVNGESERAKQLVFEVRDAKDATPEDKAHANLTLAFLSTDSEAQIIYENLLENNIKYLSQMHIVATEYKLALIYLQKNIKVSKAIELLEKALEFATKKIRQKIVYELEKIYTDRKMYDKLEELYSKIEADDYDIEADDYDEAINSLKNIILLSLANYHGQHGNKKKGYKYYLIYAKANPQDAKLGNIYHILGLLALRLGLVAEAIEHFKMCISWASERNNKDNILNAQVGLMEAYSTGPKKQMDVCTAIHYCIESLKTELEIQDDTKVSPITQQQRTSILKSILSSIQKLSVKLKDQLKTLMQEKYSRFLSQETKEILTTILNGTK